MKVWGKKKIYLKQGHRERKWKTIKKKKEGKNNIVSEQFPEFHRCSIYIYIYVRMINLMMMKLQIFYTTRQSVTITFNFSFHFFALFFCKLFVSLFFFLLMGGSDKKRFMKSILFFSSRILNFNFLNILFVSHKKKKWQIILQIVNKEY